MSSFVEIFKFQTNTGKDNVLHFAKNANPLSFTGIAKTTNDEFF